MKYLLLMFAGFLISYQTYSQNLKTKKKTSQFSKEIYQIDKKSRDRNGFYYKISTISMDTLVIGNYLNDEKTGLWTYNKMNGEKYIEYNYNSKTITALHSKALESDSTYIIRDNEFVFDKVDYPQIYLGFEGEAPFHIAASIRLPLYILKNEITGSSISSFVVDENGKIRDLKIEFSLSKELDKQILAEIKKLEGEWIPASKNGKAIASKIMFIIDVQRISFNDKKTSPNKEKDLPYLWKAGLGYSSETTITTTISTTRKPSY